MGDQWWIDRRELPDGRTLFVVPLTFSRARLTIGFGEYTYEDAW